MSNENDSILKQINLKIDKFSNELSILRSKMNPIEESILKLERARSALNDEIALPTYRTARKANLSKEILDCVISNPGLNGAEIAKFLQMSESGIYRALYKLNKKNLINRDSDKKYFANQTDEHQTYT